MIKRKTIRAREEILEDVERLKEWLAKQPHLPHEIDEELLFTFINNSKSLEIAKQRLDAGMTMRGRYPQFFQFPYRDPESSDIQAVYEKGHCYALPKPTPEGYQVVMGKLPEDAKQINHQKIVTLTMMAMDLAAKTWPDMSGMVMIVDVNYCDAPGIICKLDPLATAVSLQWALKAAPVKVKKLICFNCPLKMEMVLPILKPYMKQKFLDRIVLTNEGAESLKEHLPLEILPSDCGGAEESSQNLNEKWKVMTVQNRDWFLKNSRLIADEDKRPPDRQGTFGVEGTFKYLQID